MLFSSRKTQMIDAERALPGRDAPMPIPARHEVLGTSLDAMLKLFWENHDPTQGMRQGNDIGTQYRSAIYVTGDAQREAATASREAYQRQLSAAGYGEITTEIADAGPFYYAEGYHQQYLAKNPNGYCGLGGTGVSCPIGLGVAQAQAQQG